MPLLENLLLLPFISTFILAYAVTPLVIAFAWKAKLIDDPKTNKHPKVIHKVATPRGGGLAIYIAILLMSLVFIPIDKHLIAILAGASVLTLLGILDDKYNINPYIRLIVQFAAALMPILAGIGIAYISNPLAGGIIDLSQPRFSLTLLGEPRSVWLLSDVFALLWIVTLMNFINMGAKGVPGQLPGVAGIAAIVIAILSFKFSADITEWPVIILAAIVGGAFLGFLPFNIHPQKIMPSFSGSNLAGYFLAILSILTTTKVGVLAIVLAVPLIDTGYTIARRILSGKSPVWGDRGHLHHRLLDRGASVSQVAYFYWGITALLGVIALLINSTFKLYTIIGVSLFIGGLILWLMSHPRSS